MHTNDDTLTPLRRQAELESAMEQPAGIRIIEEQELHNVRRKLERFPEAVEAILQAAHGENQSRTSAALILRLGHGTPKSLSDLCRMRSSIPSPFSCTRGL